MTKPPSAHVNVVEASAGSGKTYELARRYTRLLLTAPHSPAAQARAILAITFTNKASVEMKERILDLLKRLALDAFRSPADKADLLAFIGMDEARARAAAVEGLAAIIRNYNFFQVQTIDSFINALLSGCAFRLDLSADFRIRRDCARYISFGLDALIEKAQDDPAMQRLFLDFLRQFVFLENKTGWFPAKTMRGVIERMFLDANAYAGSYLRDRTDHSALYEKRAVAVTLMKLLRDTEPEEANQIVFKSFRQRLEKYAAALDIDELAPPFLAPELPLRKNSTAPADTLELWRRIRRQIGDIFELESLSLFNCYIDIFTLVSAEMTARAARENLLFLPELNRKAAALFDSGITVPELYYRLATRFRHYLLDEFQDTSSLQWKNLYLLLEEALSTGGSLFYVGDKKQAIFRFRGGDASLFHTASAGFAAFGVAVDYLTNNFRSRAEIVDFNNTVFSTDNLARFLSQFQEGTPDTEAPVSFSGRDTQDILDIFARSAQTPRREKGGCVRMIPVEAATSEESEEETREKLIATLVSLNKVRGGYRGIAILGRTNRDIKTVTSWLIEARIPVESEKTLNVREHPLIKELVSLLTFLNSPIDDLSFASFILGDIFLRASGLPRGEIENFLFRRAASPGTSRSGAAYLYREFRERFPGPWKDLFEEFFLNIGFVPLYELTVSIYGKYRVCDGFPDSHGFLMKFLELIRVQVSEENADCASFLDYFAGAPDEELYVTVSETDAVKVLSIHKSKGLEFDVVLIPFLEISIDVGGKGEMPYLIDEDAEGIRLLRINKKHTGFSERLARIYTGEYKRLLIDELNTVYVALTRAKTALYAFLPRKSARGKNYARLLIPEQLSNAGKDIDTALPPDKPPARMLLTPPGYTNWIPYLREEFIAKEQLQNRRAILDGTVLHRALSFIGNLTSADAEQSVATACRRCRCQFPLFSEHERIARIVRELIAQPHLRSIFFPGTARVWCEKELADTSGAIRRIDRIIDTADELLLIDYKSSSRDRAKGTEQLAEYATLAAAAYKKKVRTFLVFLDDYSLEETGGTR